MSSYMEHEDYGVRTESPPIGVINERQKHAETASHNRDLERERQRQAEEREYHRQEMRDRELQKEMERERQRERQRDGSIDGGNGGRQSSSAGLVIGKQLTNPDPVSISFIYYIYINDNLLYIYNIYI